jgi:flagellar motor switch protein FliM
MSTTEQTNQPSPYVALDPCLLGRPVHLLPVFTSHLRDDLCELFASFNRRYKASFQVGKVALSRMDKFERAERWIAYRATHGDIVFSAERNVLLGILEYRYGHPAAEQTASSSNLVRVTATEERLAVTFGRQLVEALATRINAGDNATSQPRAFSAVAASLPRKGAWVVSVAVQDNTTGVQGSLWFALEGAWMTHLLRGLAPMRSTVNKQLGGMPPLPARLQLKLTAHLTSKEIPLGDLLEMRVGDVIPIMLGRTDVLLDDSCLFTATVAENQGKLCLTYFEDVE